MGTATVFAMTAPPASFGRPAEFAIPSMGRSFDLSSFSIPSARARSVLSSQFGDFVAELRDFMAKFLECLDQSFRTWPGIETPRTAAPRHPATAVVHPGVRPRFETFSSPAPVPAAVRPASTAPMALTPAVVMTLVPMTPATMTPMPMAVEVMPVMCAVMERSAGSPVAAPCKFPQTAQAPAMFTAPALMEVGVIAFRPGESVAVITVRTRSAETSFRAVVIPILVMS
jgi:hypothetical protein